MSRLQLTIEEGVNPAQTARIRAQDARARRNSEWLQAHWDDVLPQARGRFLAVAGEEVFIADSPDEAYERALAAHPDDDGVLVKYVRNERGPRVYAHCG